MFFRKILRQIGVIFCFAVIPALLLNEVLSEIVFLRHENEVEEVFGKMDKNLGLMSTYSDNSHYFHLLIKEVFEKASKSKNTFDSLESEINALKKTLPNEIKIVTGV